MPRKQWSKNDPKRGKARTGSRSRTHSGRAASNCGSGSLFCFYLPWLVTLISVGLNVAIVTHSTGFLSGFDSDSDSSSYLKWTRSSVSLSHPSNSNGDSNNVDVSDPFLGSLSVKDSSLDEPLKESNQEKCARLFKDGLHGKVYVYRLPDDLNEEPREEWYKNAYHSEYSERKYGFGAPMPYGNETLRPGFNPKNEKNVGNIVRKYAKEFVHLKDEDSDDDDYYEDFYFTHMHSMEVIMNERLKDYYPYRTNDPSSAEIFVIPFPFANHFRYWRSRNETRLLVCDSSDHRKLQEWLETRTNGVYSRYILTKPHLLLFGRIAYETHSFNRKGSPFWNDELYWVVSVDRNCHSYLPSCRKRVSAPHPSVYHPRSIDSLNRRLTRVRRLDLNRTTLVSFCGGIRTEVRSHFSEICKSSRRWGKWKWYWPRPVNLKREHNIPGFELCEFDDSMALQEKMKADGLGNFGERNRRNELAFAMRCLSHYEKSVFCIQEGADSTTRKGLWDALVAGCIPVFLHGVMSEEFDCFSNEDQPWFVVAHHDFYVKQLLSLSDVYISKLRRNIQRLLAKTVYRTPFQNGDQDHKAYSQYGNMQRKGEHDGFHDAVDVLFACLIRKTNQCQWSNNEFLRYDRLYQRLGI